MRKLIWAIHRGVLKVSGWVYALLCMISVRFILLANNVEFQRVTSSGVPFIRVSRNGSMKLGDQLRLNNSIASNPISNAPRCVFFVGNEASLVIGAQCGMSAISIVAHRSVRIGDRCLFGSGVSIFDTDFHALSSIQRCDPELDTVNTRRADVVIGNDVFVGAGATILKGVSIGDKSIVGARSVVTKSIPAGEIWAGNPARFVRKVES